MYYLQIESSPRQVWRPSKALQLGRERPGSQAQVCLSPKQMLCAPPSKAHGLRGRPAPPRALSRAGIPQGISLLYFCSLPLSPSTEQAGIGVNERSAQYLPWRVEPLLPVSAHLHPRHNFQVRQNIL